MLTRFFFLTVALAVAVVGLQYPAPARSQQADDPVIIVVAASYPGADAVMVEGYVAFPIEHQIFWVEGLLRIESTSGNGGKYTARLYFKPKTDLKSAVKLVQNRVALAEPMLPEVVRKNKVSVKVGKAEAGPNQVGIAVIDRGGHGWKELHSAASVVVKRLAAADALKSPHVFPQNQKQISIEIDGAKCAALGMPFFDVTDAIDAAGPLVKPEDLKKVIVRGKVTLGDVAAIKEGNGPDAVYRIDLYPAIRITGAPPEGKSVAAAAAQCVELAQAEVKRVGSRGFELENLSAPGKEKGGGVGFEIKYRHLVVEAVGPADWQKKHSFSIRWHGKDVELPVVFRVPGLAENFEMQSGGEIFGHLKIGKEKVPVTAKPDTKFQVRNTGAIAFISEKASRKDAIGISIAMSVAMSPPEFPGEVGPDFKEGEFKSAAKKLEKRVQELVDAGRVIEIAPEKEKAK